MFLNTNNIISVEPFYSTVNNPWKSGSKFLLIFILIVGLILILTSCGCKTKYKYKISKVHYFELSQDSDYIEEKRTSGISNIWYVDTFQVKNDTAFYKNKNGVTVIIPPPFKVFKIK